MNWKRIGRALVCLLVVCCLLFNMSPIQVEAMGLEALAAPVVVSTPGLNVVAAILIGLGVCVGVSVVDWDGVARSCAEWLEEQGVIDSQGKCKIIQFPDPNGGVPKWAVGGAIIDQVRNWLFANEIVKVANIGYQGTSVVNSDFDDTATNLKSAGYPLYDALHLAYAGDQVAVYGLTSSFLYGMYFNASGRLWLGKFTNPFGNVKPSYCTMYDMSSLTIVSSHLFDSSVVYATLELGQAANYSGTSYVIDWSKPDSFNFSSGYNLSIPMFSRSSSGSAFSTTSKSVNFRLCSTTYQNVEYAMWSKYYVLSGCESMSGVTSDYDVTLGVVMPADKDLTSYNTWFEGVVTVPGSQVDSVEETVDLWPIGLGQTYQETSTFTQEDVWAGTSTYTPSASEKYTGTFADTTVGSFIDALVENLMAPIKAIFVPSSDFITAKVEALRAEFSFADAIISTGEFIGTSLADLETEPPVIYIDLGATRGDYDLGGVVPFVDLRWYEEYKPTGDALLSAYMWVAFAWRMFVKAPGIISGMPGDFVMDGVNSLGMVDALPTRKKEYALQRQANRRLKDK